MKHLAVFTHHPACALDKRKQPIAFACFAHTFQHVCLLTCSATALPLGAIPLLNGLKRY